MPKLPFLVRVLVLPVGGCALATLITWKLWPFIQPSASPLFFLAVMISALYGGVVAGLIATVLSAAATAYLFMTPQFSMAIDHSDIFRLVVFAAASLLTSWIAFQRNRIDEEQQRLDGGAADGERAHQNAERHVADLPGLQAREGRGDGHRNGKPSRRIWPTRRSSS